MKQTGIFIIITTLVVCLIFLPAGAVMQEVTVKGPIATLNPTKNTLTVDHPLQYGCTTRMPDNQSVPIRQSTRPRLPAPYRMQLYSRSLKPVDPVVATSTGGPGETWITLAKLYGPRPNEEMVTDIVGDIGTIPTPLIGNYTLDATTVPDCSACSGTTLYHYVSHCDGKKRRNRSPGKDSQCRGNRSRIAEGTMARV